MTFSTSFVFEIFWSQQVYYYLIFSTDNAFIGEYLNLNNSLFECSASPTNMREPHIPWLLGFKVVLWLKSTLNMKIFYNNYFAYHNIRNDIT